MGGTGGVEYLVTTLIYGKDSERYELNKNKFTALLEEGGMHYYD